MTHAGAGSLLTALEYDRPIVAVPRLASLREHVDDHQIELCTALEEMGLVRVATDLSVLGEMLATPMQTSAMPSPEPRARLIATVTDVIASFSVVDRSAQPVRKRGAILTSLGDRRRKGCDCV